MNLINKSNPRNTFYITMSAKREKGFFNPQKYFNEWVTFLNALPCIYDCALHHVMVVNSSLHLIVTPLYDNLPEALSFVINQFYDLASDEEGEFSRSELFIQTTPIVNEKEHPKRLIRKLYQVPVKAKLAMLCEDYPFSSLPFYLGSGNPGLMLTPDRYTQEMFSLGVDGLWKWQQEITGRIDPWENETILFPVHSHLENNCNPSVNHFQG